MKNTGENILPKRTKCAEGSSFKLWCNLNFKVGQIRANCLLYCQKTSCPVTTKEEIFNTIYTCHQQGHSGGRKNYDEVKAFHVCRSHAK